MSMSGNYWKWAAYSLSLLRGAKLAPREENILEPNCSFGIVRQDEIEALYVGTKLLLTMKAVDSLLMD
jgi:hypothetical protein